MDLVVCYRIYECLHSSLATFVPEFMRFWDFLALLATGNDDQLGSFR